WPGNAVVAARAECPSEQKVALAALLARDFASFIPPEGERCLLDLPWPLARGKTPVGAEHAVEKACRVGAHQLRAHAFRGWYRRRCASELFPLRRQPTRPNGRV